MSVSDLDAAIVATLLGVDFTRLPGGLKYWKRGIEVELEHGRNASNPRSRLTNITDDDLLKTGRIALAHVLEYPDYYMRLERMEKHAHMYWQTHKRPRFMS